ncbi:DUF4357 domain-containing protein [Enterococcus casseliflavus]|nr:DUF4357 domain-containing protein [Enterococcus casseliflavus]
MRSLDANKGFSRGDLLNQLIDFEIIDENGFFLKDYTFTAPSTAADTITKGSSMDGRFGKN